MTDQLRREIASVAYLLAASCPRCRRRPADRYPPAAVEAAKRMPPHAEYRNVRCGCGQVYRIAWVSLASAEPIEIGHNDAPWAA